MSKTEIGIILTADGRLAQAGLAQVEQGLSRMGTQGAQASKQLQQGIDRASNSLSDFVGHAARLTLVTQGISGIASALNALPKSAFDYTKNLETSAVGMAGIMASVTALNGQQLEYNQALGVSQDMIRKLGDDALRTAASSQELVGAFQALLAPGLAAGMKLDEIRQLTTVGTNAVKSIGLQGAQVVQELRDLVAGGITASSSTLATALGLKDADIAKAKASAQGLFAFLMERLKGFESSSEAFGQTLQGRMDTLKEGATRVAADGMKPLTDEISRTVGAMGQLLVTFDGAGKATINPELVNGLRGVSEGLVAAMNAGQATVGVLYEHRDAVGTLAAAYAALKLGGMVSDWTRATAAKIELMQASRLAAVQAAAEGASNTALTLTSRQKTAALLSELQANVQKTAAQAAATVGTAAAIQAEQAHANAVRQLAVAQDAASVSGRAMGAVIGALGGPVGIAITALTGLAFWIGSVSQKAEAAANLALKYQRASGAAAQGKAAEAGDIAAMQAYANQLREVRDSSLQAGDAIRTFRDAKGELTYAKGSQMGSLIAKVEADIKAVTAASEKAGQAQGQLTLTLAGARQAWEASVGGIKTASSVQDDYAQKLGASQRAYQEYRAVLVATGADQASISAAATKQAQAEKALVKERDAALKSLNKTTGNASATSRDYARAVDAGLASLQARTTEELIYSAALAQHGTEADKMLSGEREVLKLRNELTIATAGLAQATTKDGRSKIETRIATLNLHMAEAVRLADVQRQNQITKESLELGQKAINDLQKQADAIRDKTAALAEENAAYGQINPTLAKALAQSKELAGQMVMTDGSVMDYERAHRAAEAWALMNGYIGQLMQQDWNKINGAVQEWQRSATEQAALYEDEARLSGLTALERAKVVAASQVELKLKKQIAEIERAKFSEDPAEDAAKKAQLIADATTAAQTESSAAVAKVVQEDWTRTSEKIEEVLIDALMDGGKSGAEYIEGLFRTMVLRPVLQVIVSPVAGAVTSALGLGGGAQSGTGSALGSLAGNSISSSLGTGAFMGAAGAGMNMALSGGMGVALEGGAAMLGSATGLTSVMAGIGQIAGALGPVALGVGALDSIIKGMDNSGTMHTGGAGGYSAARGAFRTNDALKRGDWWNNGYDKTASAIQGAQALSKVVVDMLDASAKTFGAAVGYEMWTGFADDSSSDPAWSRLMIKDGAGNTVVNNDRKFSDGEKGQAEYAAAMAQDVRNVLKASAPDWADAMLEGLGNAPSLDQLSAMVQQITATQAAFESLGKVFPQLSGMSDTFAASLLGAFGGAQNMMTAFGSFYQNFYSEAERQIAGVAQLNQAFDALGVAMPDLTTDVDGFVTNAQAARETFKQLTLDALAAGDAKLASGLLGLESQLNQLAPAANQAANYIESIEQAYQRLTNVTFTAEQAAQQRIGLEEKLLQLQGNTAELRRRELQALDASNRGLQRLVWTLEDVQSASALVLDAEKQLADAQAQAQQQQYDTQYEAAKAIADAARTAADEMKSLADTLREFVLGEALTPSELFADTLKKALGGDVEAMRALPQAATAQMDAARQSASTQADYAIARAQTLNAVQAAAALAGQLGSVNVADPVRQVAQSTTAKDPAQEALGKLNTAIEVLTMSIATALGGDLADKLGKIDTNLDGSVSESEFKAAFSGTASDNVLSKIFSALDSDGSKMITKLESIKSSTSALVTSFGTFSVNLASALVSQYGSLSTSDLSAALGAGKDTAASTKTASALDFDGSGVVTKSEAELAQSVASIAEKYASTASTDYISGASTNASSNTDNSLNSVYKELLGRDVDVSGAAYYAGKPIESVIADIKSSPEYAVRNAAGASAQNLMNDLVNSQLGISNSTKAFHTGGYTGPGGKYEAAGVVHRGEVVFSQDDIARLGGVRAVEAIRTGTAPGYADGGVVGAPVVVPAPLVPGRVTMAPRPAAPTPDPVQQEREAQARDQAQREAQQQTQDLIAQLRQVNSNLTELKRSVDKNGQSNDQMNNKIFNMADTTVKLLRKFDSMGLPVVDVTPAKAAAEAA